MVGGEGWLKALSQDGRLRVWISAEVAKLLEQDCSSLIQFHGEYDFYRLLYSFTVFLFHRRVAFCSLKEFEKESFWLLLFEKRKLGPQRVKICGGQRLGEGQNQTSRVPSWTWHFLFLPSSLLSFLALVGTKEWKYNMMLDPAFLSAQSILAHLRDMWPVNQRRELCLQRKGHCLGGGGQWH